MNLRDWKWRLVCTCPRPAGRGPPFQSCDAFPRHLATIHVRAGTPSRVKNRPLLMRRLWPSDQQDFAPVQRSLYFFILVKVWEIIEIWFAGISWQNASL